jgi:hypothetical protein
VRIAQKASAPHAAGDLDPQLAHPDDPLGLIAAEGNVQVRGEAEVVRHPGGHPGRQGVPFPLQRSAAGGVQHGFASPSDEGGPELF